MKKFLSVLVCVFLLGSVLPAFALSYEDAFDSDSLNLVESDAYPMKLEVSDFEITEDTAEAMKNQGGPEDLEAALAVALQETQFSPFSRSPSGNSGIFTADSTLVTLYDGKYHLVYPSEKRGVEDTYSNFDKYYQTFSMRFSTVVGEEGIVYSPDGRYAAIYNKRFALEQLQLFMDPILLDLSTGELFLTATYPGKMNIREASDAGAVTTAVFSADGRYFYYILYGKFENGNVRLYRYDLTSGETELCLETDKGIYYPHLAELSDGSLLALNDIYRQDSLGGLVTITNRNGVWETDEFDLGADRKYNYATGMDYSAQSGTVCLMERLGNNYAVFRIIRPESGFEGADRYLRLTKDTHEIVSMTTEEYRAAAEAEMNGGEESGAAVLADAVFSPDGKYLLLLAAGIPSEYGAGRALFLVRLEDLAVREVKGLDAEEISLGAMAASSYPIQIEWNTDELIIGTRSGIKVYRFE